MKNESFLFVYHFIRKSSLIKIFFYNLLHFIFGLRLLVSYSFPFRWTAMSRLVYFYEAHLFFNKILICWMFISRFIIFWTFFIGLGGIFNVFRLPQKRIYDNYLFLTLRGLYKNRLWICSFCFKLDFYAFSMVQQYYAHFWNRKKLMKMLQQFKICLKNSL